MELKVMQKRVEADVNGIVIINGFIHVVTYKADISDPKNAKVLLFHDHVAKCTHDDVADESCAADYGHNGSTFTDGHWNSIPDIEEQSAAYKGVRDIYFAIERGELVLE